MPDEGLRRDRAAHGDEPALDDDARHADVKHRRSEKESQERDPGHARSVEPERHEDKSKHEEYDRRSVGHQLPIVVPFRPAERVSPHVSKVIASDPNAPRGQDDHPAESLPPDSGVERTPVVRASKVVAQSVENARLHDRQQMEEPDAEEHFGAGEVAERKREDAECVDEVGEPRRKREDVLSLGDR